MIVLAITAVFSTVMSLLADSTMRLLQTPEVYIDQSITYFRITMAGMLGLSGYRYFQGRWKRSVS